ncbi:site-specific integrase [Chitinophaga ginsengisoli]|nr:site-specific integrase [Chitinophaga ginsengisoli]
MGIKKKTSKGGISIENFRGRIRLRWRLNGERYTLSLPYAYLPENMQYAIVKETEIKLDILKDCFDSSLEKYKPVLTPAISIPTKPAIIYAHELADKFEDWTVQIRNININNSFDYLCTKRLLESWVNVPIEDIPAQMAAKKWGVITYNRRLNFLRSFFIWLQDTNVISLNPLLHINKRKSGRKKTNERRTPLTEEEIGRLLCAIQYDTFCPKRSAYKHSHYYPFLKFVFLTGLRNAEAIGLRVKHIDFENKQVEISETFARTIKGTNHAARITKGTKTENVRYLPLTDELIAILEPNIIDKNPDSLVFLSPKGLSIDDRMLGKRVLKPILTALGIENRDLYVARHSFGTRAVQQGMAITDVAYLMGHSTIETTIRNYVSVQKKAIALPKMN